VRSIAVINQKGGVGKTTTAVNLSAALAACGLRVQLIDLDPQAHATLHLSASLPGPGSEEPRSDIPQDSNGPPPATGPSMYDVLAGGAALCDVRQPAGENLWLAGAEIDLAAVEVELAGMEGRELVLKRNLAEDRGTFDYTIIDCPPSLGVLTLNALAAVEEVFIPLQPHFLALHGLGKLLETIHWVSLRWNPQLRLSGVVLCLYEAGTRLAAEVARDVDQFLGQGRGGRQPWSQARVFQTRIRRNIRLAEAPSFGQSILEYARDSHGAEDYLRLAQEVHALWQAAQTPAPAPDSVAGSPERSAA
jgi:chromosome partitioning protein